MDARYSTYLDLALIVMLIGSSLEGVVHGSYCYCNVTLCARESIGGHLKLSHCFLFAAGPLLGATTCALVSIC